MVPIERQCREALELAERQGSTRLAEALRDVLSAIESESRNPQTKVRLQPDQPEIGAVTFR